MRDPLEKAVILARGLGTRMRKADETAVLDPEQATVADSGLKAMIPIGRPFLDYVLSALADAGFSEVCLVIGPEHGAVRTYYTETCVPSRLRVTFAIQERPLGTADALRAAAPAMGSARFLMINSDNYYPVAALAALRQLDAPGLAVFDKATLVREGNVDAARVEKFAVVRIGTGGMLAEIIEKPDAATIQSLGTDVWVSMNCWSFDPTIFDSCRAIGPSPRGELELTDAVRHAMTVRGQRFRVICCRAPVLDLSSRADITAVARRLAGLEVRL